MTSRKMLLAESAALIDVKVNLVKNRLWVHEINKHRLSEGEFHTLFIKLKNHPLKFFEYCRMSEPTFCIILEAIRSKIEKEDTNFRKAIPVEERLFLTLRYLSTGCSFRSLAFTFRMGKTSVARIIVETCEAIWEKLSNIYIPEPTSDEWKINANDFFNKWNFPNCLGSIDGKHIRIDQPQHSGSMYYNYKHFFSINLFAISDANYKFVAVDIGAYGRESDGGVLRNSVFFKKLQQNQLNIPDSVELPNTNIKAPYVFIGDEAFPLLTNLLRPYPGKQLLNDQKKKIFNYRLSRARRMVENVFGILSSKWRILNKAIETNVEHAIAITKAVCVLHNIVLKHDQLNNTIENLEEQSTHMSNITGERQHNRFGTLARDSRELFTEYFSSEAGSVPWQLGYI